MKSLTLTNPSTQYALFFTSPEQLQGVKLQNALDLLKKQGRLINCFVDDAHCVDLLSGSFRSAYSKVGFLKNKIGIPVTALSGSATDQTVSAIQNTDVIFERKSQHFIP